MVCENTASFHATTQLPHAERLARDKMLYADRNTSALARRSTCSTSSTWSCSITWTIAWLSACKPTLIAGLSYYGIMEIDDSKLKGTYLRLAYYTVTYLSMGMCLISGFLSTYSATQGPGYALRGRDGSMRKAVAGVAADVHSSLALFLAGTFLLFPSLILFLYAVHPFYIATIASSFMLLMGVTMSYVAYGTRKVFHLRREHIVTSHFEAGDFDAARLVLQRGARRLLLARRAAKQAPSRTSAASPDAAPLLPKEVLAQGMLLKLPSSGRSGSWQRRFLVVRPEAISWYGSMEAAALRKVKGLLPLRATTHVAAILSKDGEQLLSISEGKQSLTLKAPPGDRPMARRHHGADRTTTHSKEII